MTDLSILDKIKKLSLTADSLQKTGYAEAAALYAEKVQSLLIEHKLEMAQVEKHVLDATDPIDRQEVHPEDCPSDRRCWWADRLIAAIAPAHFCRVVYRGHGQSSFWLVGRASDREVALFMLDYLQNVMLCVAEIEKSGKGQGFKEAFYKGFVDAIHTRYKQTTAKAHNDSKALVVCSQDVQARTRELFPNMGRIFLGQGRSSNRAGLASGNAAGRSIDLGRRGVSTRPKGRLQ